MGKRRLGCALAEEPPARPVRPSLSLAVPLSIALWASAALFFTAGGELERPACIGIAAAVALLAVLFAVLLAVRVTSATVRTGLLVVLGCALGAACATARSAVLDESGSQVLSLPAGTYRFEAVADAREGDFGPSCFAVLACEPAPAAVVSVRYPEQLGPIRYGTTFEAAVRFSEVPEASRPYYRGKAAVAIATASELAEVPGFGLRSALSAARVAALKVFDGYEGRGAAFLRAILFGDRSMLEENGFYQDVKAVGLAHVVAVSGAHLSIVCALAGAALTIMRVPRKAAVFMQVVFILGYLVCAGMPLSGVRAAIMAAIALSSLFARRRSSGLNALSICICCMIAVQPETAQSASFALSVLATGGIVVFGGLAREWFGALLRGRLAGAGEALALTASSGMLTVPLSGSIFSQIPVISPVANLYAVPFFVLFCGGGLAVVGVRCAAGEGCAWLVDALVAAADLFCGGIGVLADLPIASIPCDIPLAAALGVSAAAAALIWFAWPKPSLQLAAGMLAATCLTAVLFVSALFRGTEVIVLDVGQGDAIVVRSGGSAILIDTGNQDAKLLSALARNGVYALDAVVISHPDDDHCASLAALDGTVRVKSVCVAADLLDCPCASCADLRTSAQELVGTGGLAGLSVGDTVSLDGIELSVIWPDAFAEEGGNADSLTMLMRCDADGDGAVDWTGLFCGDAEDVQLDEMVTAERLGHVDIFKVGHHGSKAAIDKETAAVISPEISLVGVGERNRYGHPAPETIAVLEEAGSVVYRTDLAGDVVCRMTSDALEISTRKVE
ncbi:ComEC/Rec2 family competence protein [Raoultibacter phocaeensis]|uniref:ComEC/Rec2 family competence protein n=1 Tax=Raoultibacter phocaeensis TaxID=2479841 RepID=UPI00111A8240|nr:ComEC/Rec2 family competence protein [Raoultibacter phocaeensis]